MNLNLKIIIQGVIIASIASVISPFLTSLSETNSGPTQNIDEIYEYVLKETDLIRKEIKLINEDRGNIHVEISNLSEKIGNIEKQNN